MPVRNSALRVAPYLLFALFFAGNASAKPVTVGTSVEATYKKGTIEAQQVERWLADHVEFSGSDPLGDFGNLGTIVVRYATTHKNDAAKIGIMGVGDNPPVPLPAGGSPGDTISITSCGGTVSQTWSYEWVSDSNGGRWVLVSYSYMRVKSCSGGGA